MTGLLLTCLLQLSPGVQLADSAPHRHIHLVTYDPYYNMGRDDLLAELSRLEATKASLVTPIVMLSIGGAFLIGTAVGFAIYDTIAIAIGVLCGIGATVFIIVGAVMLGVRLVARAHYNSDVEAVQRRLDELQRNPGVGPGPELPPPPPPPPPPGAGFFSPAPRVVVAVF